MRTDNLILAVEAAADAEHCTAHVLDYSSRGVDFCVSPHDEDAGWSGDLRVRWRGSELRVYLEHSGPIGGGTFASVDEFITWLRRELAE